MVREGGDWKRLDGNLNIMAVSLSDAARIFRKSGRRKFSEENLRKEIKEGAPVNSDGTLNLIQYAAWVAEKEVRCG